MNDEVLLDEKGNVIDENDGIPFATIADLCQPPMPKTIIVPTGNGSVKIKYMPYLSYDKLSMLQERHKPRRPGAQTDQRAFVMDVISEIMIEPKVKTEADKRAFLKGASGSLVLNLVNGVIDTSAFEEVRKELGEG